jgi:hypothetical protein
MKLIYQEDPKEWRKSALMTAVGLTLLSCVLRWRHILTTRDWLVALAVPIVLATCAVLWPRAFRGWHRFSQWLGFYLAQFFGRGILIVFFIFILTPAGLILRLMGKDLLQLQRPRQASTYWRQAKDYNSLERLF